MTEITDADQARGKCYAVGAPAILQVPIPLKEGGFLREVKAMGQYFKAVFEWLVGALGVIAVVMIMVAGIQWITAAGNAEKIGQIDINKFKSDSVGEFTLKDVVEELKHPGRDPRSPFESPEFNEEVREVKDLKDGMVLNGVVTNLTAFGAFVDVGVHQDGLVHVSELAANYVRDPNDAVKIGEVVKVKVLTVDRERHRISLSIKQTQARPEGAAQPRRRGRGGKGARRQEPGKPRQAAAPGAPGAEKPTEKIERRPITSEDIKKLVQRLATR